MIEIDLAVIIFLLPVLLILALGVATMLILFGLGIAHLCGVDLKLFVDDLNKKKG